MNIWVNRCVSEKPITDTLDYQVLNIGLARGNNVSSNIRDEWYGLGVRLLPEIYEDLFLLSLVIYAIDKRVSRGSFDDRWTRDISFNMPMLEYSLWKKCSDKVERMLSYLSGDIWHVKFRRADKNSRYSSNRKRSPIPRDDLTSYSAVSLFSGGVDSFCHAVETFRRGSGTLFVGYKDHYKLSEIQKNLLSDIALDFPSVQHNLFNFTAQARPFFDSKGNAIQSSENTSRSRSFVFIAAALTVAGIIGKGTPVYIPENGFIGLNLPLSNSRKGSCSTRTTHPHFIRCLNDLLDGLGIKHRVQNPYAYISKAELVSMVANEPAFIRNVGKTISCSHPCNERWQGASAPGNCGYCFPCLIRKASLQGLDIEDRYRYDAVSHDFISMESSQKVSDLLALMCATNTYKNIDSAELRRRINMTGNLQTNEVDKFEVLYSSTMRDIIQLLGNDKRILRLIGEFNAN